MSDHENAAQEVVDDLLTDPDKDAAGPVPPRPPQTIEDEPTSSAGEDGANSSGGEDGASGHGGRYAPTGRSEDGGR